MAITTKTIALGESASSGTFKEVSGTLLVDQPSRVFLDLRPSDIASYTREGQDLLVVTQGETLRIVDFYHSSGDSELYLTNDEGALLLAELSPAATDGTVFAQYVPQMEASPFQSLTSGVTGLEDDGLVGLALAGAGIAAALAAFGGGSGGGGGGGGNPGPGTPVDTTPPAAPTAEFNDDGSTLSGTAEPGSTVGIDLNGDGVVDISTQADADGNYSIDLQPPLNNGETVTVIATDAAGNSSPPTSATAPDTTAPAAPTAAFNDDGSVISGTAEPGSTVGIDLDGDGVVDISTQADADGNYSIDLQPPLNNGETVNVIATDAAGNSSPPTSATAPDTTAPAVPSVDGASDNAGTLTGALADGDSTDDTTPTFSGTAEAGSIVSLHAGATLLGTTTADGSGNWSFTPGTPLAEGSYSFTATSEDAAGNVSAPSAPYTLTIDTTAPDTPLLNPSDGTLLAGTSEPGSTVDIDVDGDGTPDYSVVADAEGNWSVVLDPALADGTEVSVTASDAAGNTSAPATTLVDTSLVDTIPPAAPLIASALDDVGSVTGALADGDSTDDTTPTLSGTAEAGSTVHIFLDAVLLDSVTADGSGNWSYTVAPALAEGSYSFTATSEDAAGNVSAPSTAFGLTIDTTSPGGADGSDAPTLTSAEAADGINAAELADGIQVQVGLTAGTQAGDTLTITANDGSGDIVTTYLITQDDVDAGNVEVTLDGSYPDGAYSAVAVISDAAGNSSSPSTPLVFAVDATSPGGPDGSDAPVLLIAEAADGLIDAAELADGIQAQVNLTAGTQVGDTLTVTVHDGSTSIVTTYLITQDDIDAGNVSLTLDGSYPDGIYGATAVISDAAGNSSAPSNSVPFRVEAVNLAPEVQLSSSALLGLVGAEALSLIDLSNQAMTAIDRDGNLQSVVVRYAPLLSLSGAISLLLGGSPTLTASSALATELGLSINIVNDPGVLGVLAPSSTLTITAIGGGTIDNQAINELLATVLFEQNLALLDDALALDLLNSTSITATDDLGASASTALGELADLSLLHTNASNIQEGTAGDDTLNGTAGSDRLYGYGGNDTLNGGDGNDLLRAGSGDNTLNGDGGNDVLFGGSGSDTLNGGSGDDLIVVSHAGFAAVDGGEGFDTLKLDGGFDLDFSSLSGTVSNIERIDMGSGDAGSTLTLTADAVTSLTDADNQLYISGDSFDTLNISGASASGQTTVDSVTYNTYSFGINELLVETDVQVIV
jgi:large repetitive protein